MNHHSFPSYHSHLAQMPTDQRELEYHHLPVQTIAEGTLPGALQPYGSPVTNWATSRSSLTVQSVEAHNSDSDFWGVKAPRHFEHLASSHLPKHCVPEHSAYSSFYMPSPHLATMDPSSPSMKRCKKLVDRGCDFKFLPEQSESSLSSPWIGQHNSYHNSNSYNHHVKLEDSEVASHYIPTASSSPISTSSQHYHSTTTSMTTEDSPKAHLSGEDDLPTDPPYSQLIYQALRESKDCKLQLQDIYYWFEKNTNKGKEATKGWQNSIRHNLSMNAGFVAVKAESSGGKRPVNYWCLTPEAIRNGKVESTTRYRRPLHPRKAGKSQAEPSATRRHGATRNTKHHTASASKSPDGQRANQSERQRRVPELQPPPQPSVPQLLPPPMEGAYPVPELPHYPMHPLAHQMDRMNQTLYYTWSDVTGFTDELPPQNDGSSFYEHTGVSPRWEGTMQMRPRF